MYNDLSSFIIRNFNKIAINVQYLDWLTTIISIAYKAFTKLFQKGFLHSSEGCWFNLILRNFSNIFQNNFPLAQFGQLIDSQRHHQAFSRHQTSLCNFNEVMLHATILQLSVLNDQPLSRQVDGGGGGVIQPVCVCATGNECSAFVHSEKFLFFPSF